eukprot:Tbor_TRINITY_DN6043_c1_g2::TRINITY_DN6043_c1_g2_i1::g.11011::m.11011
MDELSLWSTIADQFVSELRLLEFSGQQELRARSFIESEESAVFLSLVRNFSGELALTMSSSRAQCHALVKEVERWIKVSNRAAEEVSLKRNDLDHITSSINELKAEVSKLSVIRDNLRDEVGNLLRVTSENHNRVEQVQTSPRVQASLNADALCNVRKQLKYIRDHSNLQSPRGGDHSASITRYSPSPRQDERGQESSGSPWRARLMKLQTDLYSLRSELGTSSHCAL